MPHSLDRDIPESDARLWAMFCHLGGLATLIPFPLANIIVPLIVWLAKRHDHPYIDEQGRESVNFQITMVLCLAVIVAAVFILKALLIGYLLIWVPALVPIAQVAGSIVGAIRAYDGEDFRYPLILRFV